MMLHVLQKQVEEASYKTGEKREDKTPVFGQQHQNVKSS